MSGFPVSRTSNGVWTTVKPSGVSYIAPTSYSGSDSFIVRVSDGTLSDTVVVHVSVQNASAGTITGSSAVCEGANIYMAATAGMGTWSTSNALATINPTTGLLTGIAAGIDTIIYTLSAPCPVTAILPVTVNRTPAAGTITGADTICEGTTTTFTESVSGGVWSSNSPYCASVNASSGLVRGVRYNYSTINIKYTVTLGSCTASTTKPIFVNAPVSPLSSTLSVCLGSTSALYEYVTGGTWSVTNSRATVAVSSTSSYERAVLTGVTPGLDTIYYINTNACGTDTTMSVITVYDTVAPTITGPSDVCVGSTITLTPTVSGGYWSSYSSSIAIVSSSGVVTGRAPGRDSITYRISVSGGCVPTAYRIITVSTTPHGGTITGPTSVCTGSTVTVADTAAGGVWSVTNANATITSSGLLTGVTTGLDTVVYTVTNACGTVSTSRTETIITGTTSAGSITGPGSVCTGSSITLADATTGGTWSVTNSNATISSSGVVTGITYGYDTVVYTVTGACGTAAATMTIYINATPTVGSITGPTTVCTGAVIALMNSEPGGTWSVSNANAYFSSYGVLNGVTVGYDTVTYSLSNACGSAVATSVINIITTPNPGTITGPATVCTGSTITLADAVTGGIWSTANPRAWVSTSGVVSGITPGIDTVVYAVTNTCGTSYARMAITITDCHNTGVQETGANQAISIFPNPATSILNIEWPAGATDVHITLTDAAGRTAISESIADNNIHSRKLDLTLLPDGIYLVKVQAGGSYTTAKVILSR